VGTSFEDLQARRKPREKSVAVVVHDDELVNEIDQIETALVRQRHIDETQNLPNRAAKMEADLEKLKLDATDLAETFTFRELSRPAYRQLMADHPSKDKTLRWDEDTFAPALLHATCVSHEFTVEQWKEIWDGWGAWATAPLYATAFEACELLSRVPFGLRKPGETRDSALNLPTAAPEE